MAGSLPLAVELYWNSSSPYFVLAGVSDDSFCTFFSIPPTLLRTFSLLRFGVDLSI